MSRKLLAPLAIAVSLILAACGGDAPPADNTTAPPADAAPTNETTPPPAS